MICFLSFDDAPRKADLLSPQERAQILVENLSKAGINSVLFYASPRIHLNSKEAKALLEVYSRAGHFFGNHTLEHLDLERTTSLKYILSISAADKFLSDFSQQYYRIFRYPFSSKGKHRFKRMTVRAYLWLKGYRIHERIISNRDYLYNRKYCEAPETLRNGLREIFLEQFRQELLVGLEKLKRELSPAKTQLFEVNLHECDFTAISIGEIIACLREKGVTVVNFEPSRGQIPK